MNIDLVIGGSPCTFWSIAKAQREIDKSGMGWKLFMCFVEAVRHIKPRYFLLENVASMPASIKAFISEELGCEPVSINSSLMSAQHRKRLYWTNIKGITQPEDRGILLRDILETGMTTREKSYCIDAGYYKGSSRKNFDNQNGKRQTVYEPIAFADKSQTVLATLYSVSAKTISLKSQSGEDAPTELSKIDLPDGDYVVRKLTPIEAERCQTLPDNYTAWGGIDDKGNVVKISNTQRYRGIGNCFTVDVIAYILNYVY